MGITSPDFYRQLPHGGTIRFKPVANVQARSVVISDLLVTASKLLELAAAALSEGIVTVYADVFSVDVPLPLVANGGALSVIARRIEGADSISIDATGSGSYSLALIAQGWSVPPRIGVKDQLGQHVFDLTPGETDWPRVSVMDGTATLQRLRAVNASYDWGTPLRRSLTAILEYGTAYLDAEPDTAGEMFTHVLRITRGVDTASDLQVQAAGLLADLRTRGSTFVPYLSPQLYRDKAEAFAKAAEAYQGAFESYASSGADASARKDAAQLMLDQDRDTAAYRETLLQQAQNNYNNAIQSVVTAGFAIIAHQDEADTARIHFEHEAKLWAEFQKIEAAFEIVMAVGTVVVAVGAMAVGDEAAAPAAAKAGAEGAKAAEAAVEAAKKTGAAVSLAAQLKNAMKLAETVAKVAEQIPAVLAAIDTVNAANAMTSLDLPAADASFAEADWDAFLIDFNAAMADAVDAGINGAADYVNAVKKLVIYAKAGLAAKLATVRAGQQLIRLRLQKKLALDDQARVQSYLAKQAADANAADALEDIFYARMVGMRLWLFLTIENYRSAFKYWGLCTSHVTPSMTTPASTLQDQLAQIEQDYETVFASFNPAPADTRFTLTITADSTAYPGVIEAMRSGAETVVVPIELEEPVFARWGRVRVETLRIWLDGVDVTTSIAIDACSAGFFRDRLNGEAFEFTSAPVQRRFQYSGSREHAVIIADGSVEKSISPYIFQPTPFTEWQLRVAPNDASRLSSLTSITVEFIGSAIPIH